MKKKISLLVALMTMAVMAQNVGLRLESSQACVKSCTKYAVSLSALGNGKVGEEIRGTSTETRLTGTEYACALNQVGSRCMAQMKEKRMKRVKKRKRTGENTAVSDYLAIDYIACVYGRYNPDFEVCTYGAD